MTIAANFQSRAASESSSFLRSYLVVIEMMFWVSERSGWWKNAQAQGRETSEKEREQGIRLSTGHFGGNGKGWM